MPTASRCTECHARIARENQQALTDSIEALTALRPEHAALIQHAKSLASLLDAYPYEVKLHSEYREVLKRLLEAGAPDDSGGGAWDALSKRFAELTPTGSTE